MTSPTNEPKTPHPTNLTDEGLHEMAGGIAEFHLKADCSCEWERQCRVCGLSWAILEALKQIRDAAKKAEREACAKVADGMNYAPNSGFGRGAKDIAKAIRHIGTTNEMGKA